MAEQQKSGLPLLRGEEPVLLDLPQLRLQDLSKMHGGH